MRTDLLPRDVEPLVARTLILPDPHDHVSEMAGAEREEPYPPFVLEKAAIAWRALVEASDPPAKRLAYIAGVLEEYDAEPRLTAANFMRVWEHALHVRAEEVVRGPIARYDAVMDPGGLEKLLVRCLWDGERSIPHPWARVLQKAISGESHKSAGQESVQLLLPVELGRRLPEILSVADCASLRESRDTSTDRSPSTSIWPPSSVRPAMDSRRWMQLACYAEDLVTGPPTSFPRHLGHLLQDLSTDKWFRFVDSGAAGRRLPVTNGLPTNPDVGALLMPARAFKNSAHSLNEPRLWQSAPPISDTLVQLRQHVLPVIGFDPGSGLKRTSAEPITVSLPDGAEARFWSAEARHVMAHAEVRLVAHIGEERGSTGTETYFHGWTIATDVWRQPGDRRDAERIEWVHEVGLTDAKVVAQARALGKISTADFDGFGLARSLQLLQPAAPAAEQTVESRAAEAVLAPIARVANL